MKPLPRVYRGKVGLRLLKTTNIKGVKADIEVGTLVPEVPPIAAPPFIELAARIMRKAMSTPNFDVDDPDLQDKIIKLHKKDLPPEAILDAVRKVGFEVDLDYVMNAIGTDGQTFGDGRDLPLVDDDKADAAREKEALNTNTMRGAPEKVVKSTKGKLWNERIAAYAPCERPWRRSKTRGIFGLLLTPANSRGTSVGCYSVRKGLDVPKRPDNHAFQLNFAAEVAFEDVASLWNELPLATTLRHWGLADREQHKITLEASADCYDAAARRRWCGLLAPATSEPWAEGPILWDRLLDADMRIRSETDRKDLDRIADAVYAPRPRMQRLAKPYDGHREDGWATVIRNFAYLEDRVLMNEIGRHLLWKFNLDKFGMRERLRVGKVFVSMGWTRFRNKRARGFETVTM